MLTITLYIFSLLANEFSIGFTAPQEKLIIQKDKHIQLLLNCIYSLTLCSSAEEPRPVPEGEILVVFRNRSPLHRNECLESCTTHRGSGIERVFDLLGSTQASLFKFENTHWGIRWRIPEGNVLSRMSLPIKFICGSADASWANTYSRWDFEVFYRGALADFTVLPTSPCFKVSKKLTRSRRTEEEPLAPAVKQDWDFDAETSRRSPAILSPARSPVLEQRTENLRELRTQIEKVLVSVNRVIDEFEDARS